MSDWEQKALSQQQIVYAALDALVTGQLFRGCACCSPIPHGPSACHDRVDRVLAITAKANAHGRYVLRHASCPGADFGRGTGPVKSFRSDRRWLRAKGRAIVI